MVAGLCAAHRQSALCWLLPPVTVGSVVLVAHAARSAPRDCSPRRPLVATGRISYGLYLWSFPVALSVESRDLPLWVSATTITAVSVAMALASWFVVERPFLRRPVRAAAEADAGGSLDQPDELGHVTVTVQGSGRPSAASRRSRALTHCDQGPSVRWSVSIATTRSCRSRGALVDGGGALGVTELAGALDRSAAVVEVADGGLHERPVAGALAQLHVIQRGRGVPGEDLAAVDGVVAEVVVGDVAVLVAEQPVALHRVRVELDLGLGVLRRDDQGSR